MGTSRNGLTQAAYGLVLAAAVAVGGAGAALYVQHRADLGHSASLHRAQSTLSQSLTIRTTRLSARVHQYATELSRLPVTRPTQLLASAPRTDFTSLALAAPALPLRVTAGAALPSEVLGAESYLQNAAVTARDSASPIAVVTGSGPSADVVVLWPLYSGPVPADTQGRRSGSAGWVVGSASVKDIFSPVAATVSGLGLRAAIASTPAGPAEVQETLRDGLAAKVTAVPGPSQLGVLMIGLITAIACAGIVLFSALVRRRERSLEDRQAALDDQVRLVTDISVTIQESLDVGVVLPAVLAQISQRMELAWIRVVMGSGDEGIEVLALGHRGRALPAPRWSSDASTASAGQLIRLPLRRATRTLGHLDLVASRDLNVHRVASLRQCADLLAGALHNAELYEREHESARRLRDLDALKDDFLGTVSHELRTPLSVLSGSVSVLTGSWDKLADDSRRLTVARMQPHVASLANLVNDLLDFISDRRAVAAASPSLVQLDEEVHQLTEQLRPVVHRQDLQIVSFEPVPAWVDVRGLERIITNLVGNAGKYSPEGTTIRIEVRRSRDGQAVLSVSDEGPGIRAEDRDRIFERFYRGDSQAARTTRGSGIGLAVAMSWIQAIGARLDIRSGAGRGTTMTLHIPSSQEDVVADAGTVAWQPDEVTEVELVR